MACRVTTSGFILCEFIFVFVLEAVIKITGTSFQVYWMNLGIVLILSSWYYLSRDIDTNLERSERGCECDSNISRSSNLSID